MRISSKWRKFGGAPSHFFPFISVSLQNSQTVSGGFKNKEYIADGVLNARLNFNAVKIRK